MIVPVSPRDTSAIELVLIVHSGSKPLECDSWELHSFLTIIYLGEKSFSPPSVFLFYLTAW